MAAHRGRVPLDSHLLRVMGVWDFGSFPTDTSFVVDRPPTHFFVKKKWVGGTESTTQKVPGVFCYARDFLCGMKRFALLGISPPLRKSLPACAKSQASLCYAHTLCAAGSTPPLFPPLKKPLKGWDSKGTRPFGRSSRAEPSRSSLCDGVPRRYTVTTSENSPSPLDYSRCLWYHRIADL